MAAAVSDDVIADVLRDDVRIETTVAWDRERRDIVERRVVQLDRMRIAETTRRPSPGEEATAAILDYLRQQRLAPLPWTETSDQLRSRVEFLHREVGEPWPAWSDKELVASCEEWLEPFLSGMTSIEEVRRLDMVVILRSMLPWSVGSQVDELTPSHLETPSGRRSAIDYRQALQDGTAPVVRVRVQDLFGLTTHPAILRGRTPLVLHLLSPADRPIQITSDLPSFWRGSWSEVRKDMAGRYPKHRWPLDPTTADPKRMKDD
jgi:ATP-dependent helicase HrpB